MGALVQETRGSTSLVKVIRRPVTGGVALVGALALMGMVLAGPAGATGKPDDAPEHGDAWSGGAIGEERGATSKSGGSVQRQGHRNTQPSAAATEHNDTNDGGTPNNVVDEGDNLHPSGNDR